MTCKELNLWLLATDLLATPPREVRNHLDDCGSCQLRHQRLLNLNETVRTLPPPPASPVARGQLLRSLKTAPGPQPAPWFRQRWHYAAAVAAALLVAVGTLALVIHHQQPPGESEVVVLPNPHEASKPDVVGNVLERQLKLAKGLPQAERFQQLVGLADDLRQESLRLAQSPAPAELAAVTRLYQRVVREGKLSERAGSLPRAEQKRLIVPLLKELRQSEITGERLAGTAPADVARSLRELTVTTRELRLKLSDLVVEKSL